MSADRIETAAGCVALVVYGAIVVFGVATAIMILKHLIVWAWS
jgi:hypothetical protein